MHYYSSSRAPSNTGPLFKLSKQEVIHGMEPNCTPQHMGIQQMLNNNGTFPLPLLVNSKSHDKCAITKGDTTIRQRTYNAEKN